MKGVDARIDGIATMPYASIWEMVRKTWKRILGHKNTNSFYWREK
jgi:hypothetical protein